MTPLPIHFICIGDPEIHPPHPFMAAFYLALCGCDLEAICVGPRDRAIYRSPISLIKTASLGLGDSRLGQLVVHLRLFIEIIARRWRSGSRIFYVHGSPAAPVAWAALWGCSRNQLIYQTQDFLEPGRYPIRALFERLMARRAGHVLCNEVNRARCLASLYHLDQIPGVVPTRLPVAWPAPEFEPGLRATLLAKAGRKDDGTIRLIASPGGFSAPRCADATLRALARLPANYLLLTTAISKTSSDDPDAIALMHQLGLASRIIRLGHLSHLQLLRHLACCDIGLLLYPNDGIGNFYQAPGRLTEYLGAGLPIVASDFPGLEQLVRRYRLGRTCDVKSPRWIARAITELGLLSVETRERQRWRLRALAKTDLSYETGVSRLHEIFGPAIPWAQPPATTEPLPCRIPA